MTGWLSCWNRQNWVIHSWKIFDLPIPNSGFHFLLFQILENVFESIIFLSSNSLEKYMKYSSEESSEKPRYWLKQFRIWIIELLQNLFKYFEVFEIPYNNWVKFQSPSYLAALYWNLGNYSNTVYSFELPLFIWNTWKYTNYSSIILTVIDIWNSFLKWFQNNITCTLNFFHILQLFSSCYCYACEF